MIDLKKIEKLTLDEIEKLEKIDEKVIKFLENLITKNLVINSVNENINVETYLKIIYMLEKSSSENIEGLIKRIPKKITNNILKEILNLKNETIEVYIKNNINKINKIIKFIYEVNKPKNLTKKYIQYSLKYRNKEEVFQEIKYNDDIFDVFLSKNFKEKSNENFFILYLKEFEKNNNYINELNDQQINHLYLVLSNIDNPKYEFRLLKQKFFDKIKKRVNVNLLCETIFDKEIFDYNLKTKGNKIVEYIKNKNILFSFEKIKKIKIGTNGYINIKKQLIENQIYQMYLENKKVDLEEILYSLSKLEFINMINTFDFHNKLKVPHIYINDYIQIHKKIAYEKFNIPKCSYDYERFNIIKIKDKKDFDKLKDIELFIYLSMEYPKEYLQEKKELFMKIKKNYTLDELKKIIETISNYRDYNNVFIIILKNMELNDLINKDNFDVIDSFIFDKYIMILNYSFFNSNSIYKIIKYKLDSIKEFNSFEKIVYFLRSFLENKNNFNDEDINNVNKILKLLDEKNFDFNNNTEFNKLKIILIEKLGDKVYEKVKTNINILDQFEGNVFL